MSSPTPLPPRDPSLIPSLPPDATPEQKDQHWIEHVYQGDRMPQLTVRAVIMGGFLGMLMSAANLYTTLSIGWAFGIAITACVLSFVIWNFVRFSLGGKVSQMTVLENACMASTASAAGYSTGSTIATMFGALVLLKEVPEGVPLSEIKTWDITAPWIVIIFTLCTGLMGVFLAIPMKRQMINHEQLPFPTGTAAAETLRSLYSASAEAVQKAYGLVWGLVAGLVIGFLRVGDDVLDSVGFLKRFFDFIRFRIPAEIEMHALDRLYPGHRHAAGFAFEPSALLIAAGMIVGMRTSLSLVLSSLLLYGVVAPRLAAMDEQHLARGAEPVMVAAESAALGAADPAAAAPLVIAAVADAARTLGLDEAKFRAAAEKAANRIMREAEQSRAEAAQAAVKAGQPAPPDPSAEALREAAERLGRSVGVAVAGAAATDFSNLPATRAAAEAREAAIRKGASPDEAEKAANAVFEEKKYRPNFIWDWGGHSIILTRWSLWGGTAVMVFASLMSVALQWKTLARAFSGIRSAGERGDIAAKMAAVEVPGKWMVLGMVPITIAMVWLQIQAFSVSWYAGIIAVIMSFVLSMVASRATGETDTTPIGAMGKVMQLLFAVLAPQNVNANLASAGIAANSASSSADLLQDLKTGYLLGANPRKQFIAQFFGVFFGTVAIVPIWFLMVPTREKLESFALPATRAWEAVARVLTKGIGELPQSAVAALFIGAIVGCVLPIAERLAPPNLRKFMPSVTALGLAWVMPFQNCFSFFIGAYIIVLWTRLSRRTADKYNVPIASGLIAGESLILSGLAITATVVGLMK